MRLARNQHEAGRKLCLACPSTLKIKAVLSFQESADFQRTAMLYFPGD
jgi:hypothetical protein